MGLFYGFLGLTAATPAPPSTPRSSPASGSTTTAASCPCRSGTGQDHRHVGGAALLAGLAQNLWVRLKRPQQSGKSAYSDWFFSGLLGLTAVTGFFTEILRYAEAGTAAYVAYMVHLGFIFGLFAYFPFSKFSHLMYRSAANSLRPPDRQGPVEEDGGMNRAPVLPVPGRLRQHQRIPPEPRDVAGVARDDVEMGVQDR